MAVSNIQNRATRFLPKLKKASSEASVLNQSFAIVLFQKLLRRLWLIMRCLLDIVLFTVLLPLYVVFMFALLARSFQRHWKRVTLFAGLEHVIDKSIRRADWLHAYEYESVFYSYESTGKRTELEHSYPIIRSSWLGSVDILRYCLILWRWNPVYVEMYYEGLLVRQIFYSLASKMSGALLIAILRGEIEFYAKWSLIKKLSMHLCLRFPERMFYRHLPMAEILRSWGVPEEKIVLDFNKVPVASAPSVERSAKKVLFLNGFNPIRHLDLVIKSVPIVLKHVPDAEFILVGARTNVEYASAQQWVSQLGVESNVHIYPWTSRPRLYYEQASLFILPADLVFPNFSLLEAMERGVPPVVADVPDAEKIVQHGINGFLCRRDEYDIAKHIIMLLSDETLRKKIGAAARETIVANYNDEDRMKPILKLIEDKYSLNRS